MCNLRLLWHAEAGPSGSIAPKAAYDERASGGHGRATLVICPLVAVLQWRQEIERFTPPGTLKVCQMPSSSHASAHDHMRRCLLQLSSQLPLTSCLASFRPQQHKLQASGLRSAWLCCKCLGGCAGGGVSR